MASIRERKGPEGISYQITVSCGRDIAGRKLRETVTFTPDPTLTPKKREKAVDEFARAFEAKVKSGAAMDGRKVTLKEFSERWVEEVAKQRLQPGTVQKYKEELEEKILPALGHLKLSEIKPHTVNGFFTSFTKDGCRADGKKGSYSKATIQKTKNVLSSILRTAAEWEIIEKNPCDLVRLPSEEIADRIKFFTPEQTAVFLDYIEKPYKVKVGGHERKDDTGKKHRVGDYELTREIPEQIRVLFNLAIYTGLRKGELLALRWEDIDFKGDQISVSKAVTMVDGEQQIKAPKTRTSRRKVSIPHFLTVRLQRLKVSQTEYRLKLGQRWKGDNWVFTQIDDGRMMNYSTPYQALQDAIRRYNEERPEDQQLPAIPFHGLRHTSATLLIASGQDIKTTSKRLGHAQTSTTMNIYAHALEESDKKAASALETMLAKRA